MQKKEKINNLLSLLSNARNLCDEISQLRKKEKTMFTQSVMDSSIQK